MLSTIPVKEALNADYEADTDIYESFMDMLASSGSTELRSYAGEEFSLGSAKFQIISPSNYTHDKGNYNSIAFRVSYEKYSGIIKRERRVPGGDRDAFIRLYSKKQSL